MATSAANSTAMPSRIRRGLSRNGRRDGDASPAGSRRGDTAGRPASRTVVAITSPEERELREAGDVAVLPRPHERGVARRGARTDAEVVLGVALQGGIAEERELVEAGQPVADV